MNGVRRSARALRHMARRFVEFLRELSYWQRRKAVLSLAPDRYLANPDKAPDTYREFMARTYGPLIREPSFKARLAGRRVG
jgi:hypothetical protein